MLPMWSTRSGRPALRSKSASQACPGDTSTCSILGPNCRYTTSVIRASASLRTPPGITFVVRSRIFFTTISGASVWQHSTSSASPCRRRVPRPGRHHASLNGALVEAVLIQLSTVCLSGHPHTLTNIELLGRVFAENSHDRTGRPRRLNNRLAPTS